MRLAKRAFCFMVFSARATVFFRNARTHSSTLPIKISITLASPLRLSQSTFTMKLLHVPHGKVALAEPQKKVVKFVTCLDVMTIICNAVRSC